MVGEGHDIAATALAEDEIGAGDDPRRAIAFEQQFGDEILRRRRGERGVEREDEHRVGARRAEQLLPLVERGQAEGRHVGFEEAHRMRVEGRDDRRAPVVLGMMHRAADHRLVPGVKAVEIAERDDAAAQRTLDAFVAVEADHRRRTPPHAASPSEDEGLCRATSRQRFSLRSNKPLVFAWGNGKIGPATYFVPMPIGTIPARMTRSALPPIAARMSSSLKPASSSACVT